MVRQMGYWVPPWQSLHRQRVPSAYQHANFESAHTVPLEGGGMRHAGGNGGALQPGWAGGVTFHVLSTQVAVVRHAGRGSSPQVQCALGGNVDVPPIQGGEHAVPAAGGLAGQAPEPEPPAPVVVPLLVPPDVEPPPPAELLPVEPPELLVSPPQAPQRTPPMAAPKPKK